MTKLNDFPDGDVSPKMPTYQIERRPDGVRVFGKDRGTVTITLEKTCLRVDTELKSRRIGLCCYRSLIEMTASAAMRNWTSPKGEGYQPKWIRTCTAKPLNARIYPIWQELLERADPKVVAVHRKMFAASCRVGQLAFIDKLYSSRYIVSDIVKFPAAAIAAVGIPYMASTTPWILDRHPYTAAGRYAAEDYPGYNFWPPITLTRSGWVCPDLLATAAEKNKLHLDLMANWRSVFSADGVPYPSLNKTLMNLPGRMTLGVLCRLSRIRLERPVLERLELMTICLGTECRQRHHDHIFAHARKAEIEQAMAVIGEERLRRVRQVWPNQEAEVLSPLRTRDISFVTRYLSDFPEIHHGRIIGLAQKAVEWHRDQQNRETEDSLESLGLDESTKQPSIPLPKVDGIRFLATVREIRDEARLMQHCVASYARTAINGLCFLFHVEKDGVMATVEVDQAGRVIQAMGPHNTHNSAASWGRNVLGTWAGSFPDSPAPILTTNHDLPF